MSCWQQFEFERETKYFLHFLDIHVQIYTLQMSKYTALLNSLLIGQYSVVGQ